MPPLRDNNIGPLLHCGLRDGLSPGAQCSGEIYGYAAVVVGINGFNQMCDMMDVVIHEILCSTIVYHGIQGERMHFPVRCWSRCDIKTYRGDSEWKIWNRASEAGD